MNLVNFLQELMTLCQLVCYQMTMISPDISQISKVNEKNKISYQIISNTKKKELKNLNREGFSLLNNITLPIKKELINQKK